MFAHSIKNPEIIHYFIRRSRRAHDGSGREIRHWSYLCMQACSTTPSKRTRNVLDVTCLNCLRDLGKLSGGFWNTKTIQSGKVTFYDRAKPKKKRAMVAEDLSVLGAVYGGKT
jgi:hypothetical protein